MESQPFSERKEEKVDGEGRLERVTGREQGGKGKCDQARKSKLIKLIKNEIEKRNKFSWA